VIAAELLGNARRTAARGSGLAGAAQQLLAAFRQVDHPQLLAGARIAVAQYLERLDGRVVHEGQTLAVQGDLLRVVGRIEQLQEARRRSEEHTSELQSRE